MTDRRRGWATYGLARAARPMLYVQLSTAFVGPFPSEDDAKARWSASQEGCAAGNWPSLSQGFAILHRWQRLGSVEDRWRQRRIRRA